MSLKPLFFIFVLASCLHSQTTFAEITAASPDLSCGPAPCVLPNVAVSRGGYPRSTNLLRVNPIDPRIMVLMAQDENCTPSRQGIFRSQDSGTTWIHSCLPLSPDYYGGAAGLLAYDRTGILYAATSVGSISHPFQGFYTSSSLDNGATWSKPILVSRIAGPVWMEVDNNPASPFQGSIYIAASRLSPGLYNVIVFFSRDGGKTWQSRVVDRTSGQINESPTSLALASDGAVYVALSKCKYLGEVGCITEISSISKSIDGGSSWSTPSQVDVARIPFVGFDIQLNFSPVLAIDNSDGSMRGTIYLVDYTEDQTHGYIAVTSSRDGGASWSPPVHVSNSGAGFQVYQAASVSDDGVLAITWLQLQPDNHYRPFCATSKDGRTFSSRVPLSQNFSQLGYHTGFFRSQAWVGKTLYATWIASENNYQVTIGGIQF